MANEAVLIVQTGLPINMTVADGTGIEKGALLKLADPFTASDASALNDVVAGIAASEKIASDGVTKLGVFRQGIFKMTASGSVTVGNAVVVAPIPTANKVEAAGVNAENLVGTALETATDGETFLVELKPMTINVA